MTIATRTPEGFPSRCRICGKASAIDYSSTGADAVCPTCGSLLSFLSGRLAVPIDASTRLEDLGIDSLELVDLVMQVEHGCNIALDDAAAEEIHTVADLLRYLSAREQQDD